MNRTKLEIFGAAALIFLLAFCGYVIYDKLTDRPVGSESIIARVAPAVTRQPTAKVTIKAPVVAYQGKTKANLKLPDAVQKDEKEQVIAASEVKGDLHPQTVSTVVNTETGQVQTFVKTDPYPWLAIENRGSITMAYGLKYQSFDHASHAVGRLQVGYDVLRVKALTVGITGTLDTDRDAFVGVGISYRW